MNEAAIETIGTAVVLAGERPVRLAQVALLRLAAGRPRPYLIAADGGALHLAELSLKPDLIIGDNDSCSEELFPEVERQLYPRDKDFTDGEAAYDFAVRRGQGRIAVFAALGGRLDHCLANLLLPLRWLEHLERFILFGPDCEAVYSRGSVSIAGQPGDIVSVLPLTPRLTGVTLSGLVYPLDKFDLTAGSSHGLCNVMAAPEALIRHHEGVALIIHYPSENYACR
jgi:thiamine pyrophosphokinase